MSDPEQDIQEQEQARLLALALDGRSAPGVPEDALEAGALLRVVNDPGLSDARADALLEQVLSEVRQPPNPVKRPVFGLGWLALWPALGLSALVVALFTQSAQDSSAALPAPSLALIEAQAARLQGQDAANYEQALAAYRRQAFAVLRSGDGGE